MLVIGIIFVFFDYVIVIGQTKPVLVALNKADSTMAIIDPAATASPKNTRGDILCTSSPMTSVLSMKGNKAYQASCAQRLASSSPP